MYAEYVIGMRLNGEIPVIKLEWSVNTHLPV